MKLFIASLATETNTFSPMPTGAHSWDEKTLADMRPEYELTDETLTTAPPPVIWEYLASQRNWEIVDSPIHRFAQPAGLIVRSVYESFRDQILADLEAQLPVDAVLLALHGGSVAEGYDDPEGDLIRRVRDLVGEAVPIGVLLDPHTNLGEEMMEATALLFFREYPHTDVPDRAIDLFHLILDAAEGQTNPVMAVFDCRMVSVFQTPRQPLRGFIDRFAAMAGNDGVLAITLCQGFPYSDVPIGGAKLIAITDGDSAKAAEIAEKLGQELFSMRHEIQADYRSITEALDIAEASTNHPVIIADYADNAGGGAPGDSTFLLQELLDRGIQNAAFGMIWDPIAVEVAIEAGVGATLDLRIGGKMGPSSGSPVDVHGTITALKHDAVGGDTRGQRTAQLGDLVNLRVNGIDILLNTRRQQVLSPICFTEVGVDPTERDIVVVKSSQHFYAQFEPIAGQIIYARSGGSLSPVMTDIPYQRLPTDRLWPWVENPFEM